MHASVSSRNMKQFLFSFLLALLSRTPSKLSNADLQKKRKKVSQKEYCLGTEIELENPLYACAGFCLAFLVWL